MSLEKAKIDGAIYDVISRDEYVKNPQLYDSQYVAIKGNDGFIYPIRSRTDNRPGYYTNDAFFFYKQPAVDEYQTYSSQNIINFKNAETLRDIIKTQQKLVSEERTILTTIDNVFAPDIGENDTPEMKATKQAILDKHIDLDKYEPRFGPNYNNDKRLLKKGRITFDKLRAIADALDIKATLTLEDKNPDVPNPIGRVITVDITENTASIEDDGTEYEEE